MVFYVISFSNFVLSVVLMLFDRRFSYKQRSVSLTDFLTVSTCHSKLLHFRQRRKVELDISGTSARDLLRRPLEVRRIRSRKWLGCHHHLTRCVGPCLSKSKAFLLCNDSCKSQEASKTTLFNLYFDSDVSQNMCHC